MQTIIYVILACVFVVSCASNPKENFEKVKVGMGKDTVIDTVGSPALSEYRKDEQVWVYRMYEGEKKIDKEIRLKKDVVVYVGEGQTLANPFDRIKVGMDKAEVLDLLGFPKRVEKRGKQQEVWIYVDGKISRTLVVSEGKVSSLGVPPKETREEASDGFVPVEQ